MRYRFVFSLAIAALATALATAPRPAHAVGTGVRASKTVMLAAVHAKKIPGWARKYNMNCSGCHYPTVPRLNATGLSFKWAGYRMPNEIGKNAEVKKIEDYLAARLVTRYVYTKNEKQGADTNSVILPSASVFAAGAVGTNYGAFLEFERTPDGAVDLIGQLNGVWGKEKGFGGVRIGQGHLIVGGAAAGFDRPTGILGPLALDASTTPGVPFRLSGDLTGIEGFYVFKGMNRTSVGFVNGITRGGDGMGGATSTTSGDFVVANQLMLDDYGAALAAVAYLGSARGLDTAQAGLNSRYYRLGLSANKFVGPFEAQAGYVYSNNSRLPTGAASPFPSARLSGTGYWIYGGYTAKPTYLTVFGRYELVDPNRGVSNDALRRVVLGSVLPVNVPEYLRLGLEYFFDNPQASGALQRQGARAEFQIAF